MDIYLGGRMYGDTIPQFIAVLRHKHGWTQQELATKTGVKERQYISGMERGIRPAPFGFCFLLLEYCDKKESEHLIWLAKYKLDKE